MITGSGLAVVDEAERMVAEVRDDPAGRIRLAADAYAFGRGGRRYRPYRRAVVAFMRWQQGRGVLNSLDDDMPGSPWWRAVNENLLRDTVEAKLIVQRGEGQPSWPSVAALGELLQRSVGAVVVRGAQCERRGRLPGARDAGCVRGSR